MTAISRTPPKLNMALILMLLLLALLVLIVFARPHDYDPRRDGFDKPGTLKTIEVELAGHKVIADNWLGILKKIPLTPTPGGEGGE